MKATVFNKIESYHSKVVGFFTFWLVLNIFNGKYYVTPSYLIRYHFNIISFP